MSNHNNRRQCEGCGDFFVPSKLQAEDHTHGVRKCRTCYSSDCTHETTTALPQSGNEYCTVCGKVLEQPNRQLRLTEL